jgi:hypothetical protein
MKLVSQRLLFIIFITLCGTLAFSQVVPPAPAPPPPPPPGLPVDENIFILFSAAILLGTYIIYKNNLKTKNPI